MLLRSRGVQPHIAVADGEYKGVAIAPTAQATTCLALVAGGQASHARRRRCDSISSTRRRDPPRDGWRRWCDHARVNDLDVRAGLAFDDAALVLPAAQGQGVAPGRLTLAERDLRAGRLVQPFEICVPNDYSYWLVYPPVKAERPDVAAFRAWLLAQAGQHATDRRREAGTPEAGTDTNEFEPDAI
ncbi:hypothetical protein CIW54_14620 [Paraburkholderia sp. T12-10]|nr:hypothetical protein CIW54_14620 [Paraburkholderia sp. T12-10]